MNNISLPNYLIEKNFIHNGAVIGVDEVGRGSWAGPLTLAAFWINPKYLNNIPKELKDSKLISKQKRQEINLKLTNKKFQHCWKILHINVSKIDEIGIQNSTLLGIVNVVNYLSDFIFKNFNFKTSMVLIDGNLKPKISLPFMTIVKGDQKCLSIAAASIIAKVNRDLLMNNLDSDFPNYNWKNNVGYGTRDHLNALKQFGITKHHRKSFKPIKNLKN